jgi:hypothetical protein
VTEDTEEVLTLEDRIKRLEAKLAGLESGSGGALPPTPTTHAQAARVGDVGGKGESKGEGASSLPLPTGMSAIRRRLVESMPPEVLQALQQVRGGSQSRPPPSG